MLSSKNGEINGENDRIKPVLDLLAENPYITLPDIALRLNYSESKVNRIIAELRKSGLLFRKGSNKTGRWVVKATTHTSKHQAATTLAGQRLEHYCGIQICYNSDSFFYKWLIPSEFYSTAPRVVIIFHIKHCWIAIAVESPNVVGGIGVIFIYFRVRNS